MAKQRRVHDLRYGAPKAYFPGQLGLSERPCPGNGLTDETAQFVSTMKKPRPVTLTNPYCKMASESSDRQVRLQAHTRKDQLTACATSQRSTTYTSSNSFNSPSIRFLDAGAVIPMKGFVSSATSFQDVASWLACAVSSSMLHCWSPFVAPGMLNSAHPLQLAHQLACGRILIMAGALHESKTLAAFLGCAACTHVISAVTHVWPDSMRLVSLLLSCLCCLSDGLKLHDCANRSCGLSWQK